MIADDAMHDYLGSIGADGRALLSIAADVDQSLAVPTCPGWTLRNLLEHVAGANRWVSHCVASGLSAQERVLPSGPGEPQEFLAWVSQSFEELLAVLAATPPDELVWTPLRGASESVWWRRKAAVEVAIHRADAESAFGVDSEDIDATLALDGIDEYAEDFLPLMLLGTPEPPPVTAVLLSPSDIDASRVLSLIPAGDQRDPGPPSVSLAASASELLLWMWNRTPRHVLTVGGDDAVVQWWRVLTI